MEYLQKKIQSKNSVQELILNGKKIVFKEQDKNIFVEIKSLYLFKFIDRIHRKIRKD